MPGSVCLPASCSAISPPVSPTPTAGVGRDGKGSSALGFFARFCAPASCPSAQDAERVALSRGPYFGGFALHPVRLWRKSGQAAALYCVRLCIELPQGPACDNTWPLWLSLPKCSHHGFQGPDEALPKGSSASWYSGTVSPPKFRGGQCEGIRRYSFSKVTGSQSTPPMEWIKVLIERASGSRQPVYSSVFHCVKTEFLSGGYSNGCHLGSRNSPYQMPAPLVLDFPASGTMRNQFLFDFPVSGFLL